MYHSRIIQLLIIALGFSLLLAQLVIIREFLNIFQGNELIIGFILCIWMISVAYGSTFRKSAKPEKNNLTLIRNLFLITGLFPGISLLFLYAIEIFLFPVGVSKGFFTTIVYAILFIFPVGFTGGYLYSRLANALAISRQTTHIFVAYGMDCLGGVLAGLTYSFLFSAYLNSFQISGIIMIVNSFCATVIMISERSLSVKWIHYISAMVIASLFCFLPIDRQLRSYMYKGQNLVYTKDTPYGNLAVTSAFTQYNIFENGSLLYSTDNLRGNEEAIHFALLQLAKPEKIMVISGGASGMSSQCLKYPSVQMMDYAEINPWLLKAEKLFTSLTEDTRIRILNKDGRKWIRKQNTAYDAIIVNTPDPLNAELNRYYTVDFYTEAKKTMTDSGVFEISLSSTSEYMNQRSGKLNGMIYQSLKKVFQNVLVLPGERNYFIASDAVLKTNIASLSVSSDLQNQYVNSFSMSDDLLKQRSAQMLTELEVYRPGLNTDSRPNAYFLQAFDWIGKYEGNRQNFSILLIAVILLIPVIILKYSGISAISVALFTGTFAGASSQFIMVMLVQIFYGNIYKMLGLIFALYMAGLYTGTIIRLKHLQRAWLMLLIVQIALILAVTLIPLVFKSLHQFNDYNSQVFIFLFSAVTGFLTGLEFKLSSFAVAGRYANPSGKLYGVDLAGSSAGTFITSVLFIPLIGLTFTCLAIASLLALGAIILIVSKNSMVKIS